MSILGTRVPRIEDAPLLEGRGRFVDDLREPALAGALRVGFVRSFDAHGLLGSINSSEAEEMAGVVAAFTAADLDLVPPPPGGARAPAQVARPWLAADRVRFAGEPLAIVVTESAAIVEDAIEGVIAEVDPLPAVVGIDAAFGATASEGVLLFPETGSNRNSLMGDGWGDGGQAPDEDPFWQGCEVIARGRVVNQRVAGVSLEGRASAAAFANGRLTQWVSSQNAHGARRVISAAHGLDTAAVWVVLPDVGGGFGPKINLSPEDVLVGWVARRLGRPAIWVENRDAVAHLGVRHIDIPLTPEAVWRAACPASGGPQ